MPVRPNQDPPTSVRLPVDLRDWLRLSAKTNNRSLNQEIVYRLKQEREKVKPRAGESAQGFGVTPQTVKVSGDSHEG